MARKPRLFEDRFFEKIDKSGECWVGHAYIRLGGRGSPRNLLHRWMVILQGWETYESLQNKQVIQTCGNHHCVNPGHLRVVEHAKKGSLHHNTHLVEEDVVQMRKERDGKASLKELAKKYRVSIPTVCRIVLRQAWTHVE